ncbi:MAG TPA: MerR family transcriptional regulator [Nocardioidaceae bacterium]|jgi:DNA-binding transcriptional MerR regulator|nr:MerR family transcriptional regulator [Nocardioidaceae bacterium]
MSIGELLDALRTDFPDVTISKIRYLEAEGLVEPERTAAGYRKFSAADLERLRYVLQAQRERYLPLRVIKDHLDGLDRGLEPPETPGAAPRVPVLVVGGGLPDADSFRSDPAQLRLTRVELLQAAGIDEALLEQCEGFGLIARRNGTRHYDGDALLIATTLGGMAGYGLEPRHLRSFKTAADREVGLFEQVVSPLRRQRDSAAAARADNAVRELAALSVRLHATLVKTGLQTRR